MKEFKMPYIYDSSKFHKLVNIEGDYWKLIPAEPWMLYQLNYFDDCKTISSIDTDGLGRAICVDDIIFGYKVESIDDTANYIRIKLTKI